MFLSASSFDQDISTWQTSNVKDFSGMFNGAASYNRDLPWDFSSACSVDFMFYQASSLNQDFNDMGRQLQANLCGGTDGAPLTTFDIFSGTSCQVTDPTAGVFCRPTYDLSACLAKRVRRIRCMCKKQTACRKVLSKGSCQRKASKAGISKKSFNAQVETALANHCGAH